MSEETFVKSSSLLFPSWEGLGVGSAFCPLPSTLFIESHCKFRSPLQQGISYLDIIRRYEAHSGF
ncbi:MAG: hypothetical protein F6K14_12290 [Symploca sp. SIO2C1]|nr:hypothetical protein [Symploca sp. SIO2C1]